MTAIQLVFVLLALATLGVLIQVYRIRAERHTREWRRETYPAEASAAAPPPAPDVARLASWHEREHYRLTERDARRAADKLTLETAVADAMTSGMEPDGVIAVVNQVTDQIEWSRRGQSYNEPAGW